MTSTEFAYYVRLMTQTNATTFTDQELLALMKIRQEEIAKDIIDADEDIFLIPQYSGLVANQREYPLPIDMLSSIKRVEAKLDGTNFIKLNEIDINSINTDISTESNITFYFSNQEGCAFYDLSRKSIYIYSGTITNVSAGLRAWVNIFPEPITDLAGSNDMSIDPSTTTFGIPKELHEIWARGVIIDWKGSRPKPIPLTERELSYKTDKIVAINSLKPQNRNRKIKFSVPEDDGSNY